MAAPLSLHPAVEVPLLALPCGGTSGHCRSSTARLVGHGTLPDDVKARRRGLWAARSMDTSGF